MAVFWAAFRKIGCIKRQNRLCTISYFIYKWNVKGQITGVINGVIKQAISLTHQSGLC